MARKLKQGQTGSKSISAALDKVALPDAQAISDAVDAALPAALAAALPAAIAAALPAALTAGDAETGTATDVKFITAKVLNDEVARQIAAIP